MTFTSDSFLTLSDAEITLLVHITFGLDPFQNSQTDLSPISDDAAGFQMPNVDSFAVPVEHTDVGMGIATNDGALDACQLDRAGEVPEFFYHRNSGIGNGMKMHPLQRTNPSCDSSSINMLLLHHLL